MNLDPLSSLLLAVIVLLVGALINRRTAFLSRYNVPDPVTGGLLFALVFTVLLAPIDFSLEIDHTLDPVLLLMFFAGVGLCADLSTLKHGGKALVIFLMLLLPMIVLQNVIGVSMATLLDLHPIFGAVAGSITLTGGHGTGAAYATRFAEVNNLQYVMELSMTTATIGLIAGGVLGGPIAQYLITRHKIRTRRAQPGQAADANTAAGDGQPAVCEPPINTVDMLVSLAGALLALVGGKWLAGLMAGAPITIPNFLWCMVLGILIRNLSPFFGLRMDDRASSLIANVSLALFLVLAMMNLDLIDVARSAGPILLIVAAQVTIAALYATFICYRFMGRDYEAAVTSAAFMGVSVGTTATAMANMQAVTAKYGPAPTSFLIVPLSGAFFVDIMNALILTVLLSMPFMGG